MNPLTIALMACGLATGVIVLVASLTMALNAPISKTPFVAAAAGILTVMSGEIYMLVSLTEPKHQSIMAILEIFVFAGQAFMVVIMSKENKRQYLDAELRSLQENT